MVVGSGRAWVMNGGISGRAWVMVVGSGRAWVMVVYQGGPG